MQYHDCSLNYAKIKPGGVVNVLLHLYQLDPWRTFLRVSPLVTPPGDGLTIHELETIHGLKTFYKELYISETGLVFYYS